MNSAEHDYFWSRWLEEDQAARSARCIEARLCHQQLADAYRRRYAELPAESGGSFGSRLNRGPAGPVETRLASAPAATGQPTL